MNIIYGVILLITSAWSQTVETTSDDVDFQFIYQLNNVDISEPSSRQTIRRRVKFKEPSEEEYLNYDLVSSEKDNQGKRVKFEDDVRTLQEEIDNQNDTDAVRHNVAFEDGDIKVGDIKKRPVMKLKRRRKSRRWMLAGADIPQPHPSDIQNILYPPTTYQPGIPVQKKRPNFTSFKEITGPLGIIGEALASIIENDSKQCVMRMLCEQAAGNQLSKTSLPSSIAYLMQYLPGITKGLGLNGFPIFKSVGTFAVATLIGSETKNLTACELKFSDCPSDPEERIHYLNNHNGGLFRFFKGKDHHQYSPAEFHDYLVQMGLPTDAGQNGAQQPYMSGQYGVYTPAPTPYGAYQGYPGQYGLQQPSPSAQQPTYLPSTYLPDINTRLGINSGFSRPNLEYTQQRPTYAPESQHSYAAAYSQYRRFNIFDLFRKKKWQSKNPKNDFQDRIQNKPGVFANNDLPVIDATSPDTTKKPKIYKLHFHNILDKMRVGRTIKFPGLQYEKHADFGQKQGNGFLFPGKQSNRQYMDISHSDDESNDDSVYGNSDNSGYVSDEDQSYDSKDEEGLLTVYVLRGNSDPNHPEIIKLRPGDKIF